MPVEQIIQDGVGFRAVEDVLELFCESVGAVAAPDVVYCPSRGEAGWGFEVERERRDRVRLCLSWVDGAGVRIFRLEESWERVRVLREPGD